jgi:pilus assembly protein CpaB
MHLRSNFLIIVGAILLLAAVGMVALTFASSRGLSATSNKESATPEPMVPVVVAEIDINEGTVITSTDGLLRMDEVPASEFNDQVHLTSVTDAHNMVATTTIKAGDPIYKSSLREAGLAQKIPAPESGQTSMKAFPIQVNSLSGVADLIHPGDFVDVVASFNLDVVTFHPGAPQQGEGGSAPSVNERVTNEGVSKVLLQDIEVLDIIKPGSPVEGEKPVEPTPPPAPNNEGGNAPPATAANTLDAGNWLLVLAVTSDEAEVLRFVLDRGIGITTVLRRAGDHTNERTVGATMRILAEVYQMPLPSFPQVMRQPGVSIDGVPQLAPIEPATRP